MVFRLFDARLAVQGISTILVVTVLSGCGVRIRPLKRYGIDGIDFGSTLVVQPRFPLNGANWNDYVDDPSPDTPFDGDDTACSAVTAGYRHCLHGGEKRIVEIPGVATCDGLSLRDVRGVFEWVCDDSSGEARFYSLGVNPEKGLRDLIDPDANSGAGGWHTNSVILSGRVSGTSQSAQWWTNPVQPLPDNSAGPVESLDDASTIYFLANTRESYGYNINAEKIAIVTLGDSVLRWSGDVADNCSWASTGEIAAADQVIFLCAGSESNLWVEVSLDGYHAGGSPALGIFFSVGVTRSRVHRTSIANMLGGYHGLEFRGATNHSNLITELRSQNNSVNGIEFWNNSHTHTVLGAVLANNGAEGMRMNQTADNVVQRVVAFNNQTNGLEYGAQRDKISLVTSVQNNYGFRATGNDKTLHLAFTGNNVISGIVSFSGSNLQLSQIATLDNATDGIHIANISNYQGGGALIVGNNGSQDCRVTLGTGVNPGLTDTTCTTTGIDGSNTYAGGSLFTSTLRTSRTAATSFIGKISADSENTLAPAGTSSYSADPLSMDWFRFESMFRGWGIDGSAFPNVDHGRRCSAGVCRIWDWTLALSDTVLRGVSGDGATQSTAPTSVACPPAVYGDQATSNSGGETYLLSAFEIIGDESGDDDGLCESSEACIYAPHIGAYQGSGTFRPSVCPFDDAGGTTAVVGVTMHYYPDP